MICLLEHLKVYLCFHYPLHCDCGLTDLPIQLRVKRGRLDYSLHSLTPTLLGWGAADAVSQAIDLSTQLVIGCPRLCIFSMLPLTSFLFILGGTQPISEFKLILVDPDVRRPRLLRVRFVNRLENGELLASEVVQGRVVSQVLAELQVRDQRLQVLIAQRGQVEVRG